MAEKYFHGIPEDDLNPEFLERAKEIREKNREKSIQENYITDDEADDYIDGENGRIYEKYGDDENVATYKWMRNKDGSVSVFLESSVRSGGSAYILFKINGKMIMKKVSWSFEGKEN